MTLHRIDAGASGGVATDQTLQERWLGGWMLIAHSLADTVLLDVTLCRDDHKRRWTISEWTEGWRCQYLDEHRFSYANCPTKDGARAKRRAWEADIAAARAEGWR